MTLKKILAMVLSVMMALSFAACGAEAEPAAPSTTPESEASTTEEGGDDAATGEITSTELNLIYSGSDPTVEDKDYVVNTFFKKFEEEYGVTVNLDFIVQADAYKKIETEQASGNYVTDIIYMDTANTARYIQNDFMVDVTGAENDGATVTTIFDSATRDGDTQYFIPVNFDVYVLAANVKAIEYLPEGITQDDVVAGITWETYVEWANNIAAGEGVGKAMMPANMTGSQLLYPIAGMSMAYGGGFPEFTSDAFKTALGHIATMSAGNAFYPEQDQYTNPTDPMNSGDVWLTFAHMGPIGQAHATAPNEWVIGAAPTGTEGAGSTAGSWTFGIPKGAPHEDLARALIDFVTIPENNYDFCSNLRVLSTVEEVSSLLTEDDAIMKASSGMLATTIVSGVPATEYTDWNAVKLLYGDIYSEIMSTNEVPSDDFLAEKQAALEALKITE